MKATINNKIRIIGIFLCIQEYRCICVRVLFDYCFHLLIEMLLPMVVDVD